MRVLIVLAALVAAPLVDGVAQQRGGSERPQWAESKGRGQAEARRAQAEARRAAEACRAEELRDARQASRDDDDDDGDRRSRERQARERRAEEERRAARAREARRSGNNNRGDDDDDDDDDDGDRRQACDPAEPPAPPPPPPPPTGGSTSSIGGLVFHDANGNSMRDAGEPGIANWRITLSSLAGDLSAFTDAAGAYSFSGLVAGSYVICQMLPGGAQTIPLSGTVCAGAAGYEFTLTTAVNQVGFDFGHWID